MPLETAARFSPGAGMAQCLPASRSRILYGRALQIDAELGAEFIFRRVLAEKFDDRMKQFIVVMVSGPSSKRPGRVRNRRREPRDIVAKAKRRFGIKRLPNDVGSRVGQRVRQHRNRHTSAFELHQDARDEPEGSDRNIRENRLRFKNALRVQVGRRIRKIALVIDQKKILI